MLKKMLKLTAVLVVLCPFGNGEAKTLATGMSGVINTPSAYVRSMGHFGLTYQYTNDYRAWGGNIAVLPSLEISYSHWEPEGASDFDLVNAKFMVLPETVASPAVSIGVEDLTDERRRSGFVALSKAGPWGLALHAGVGTGRYRDGYIALEKQFKLNSDVLNLGVALEYDGEDMNYGLFVPVGKLVRAEAGMRNEKFYAALHGTF
ncbi:MAG TPA: YjbH domain-containing protein [Candidatus Avacidaminococcus intestinavium]|uniref:YjbH domain-containing protein n=1 Tax=Candidatus Avacidaminococcus intestinavium TaxID=2840684 RepID=A0A9D1MPH5_9FIRM|nr:YjbH domain-containing protein [Candidatus Avacidaminococcus intestinavium]